MGKRNTPRILSPSVRVGAILPISSEGIGPPRRSAQRSKISCILAVFHAAKNDAIFQLDRRRLARHRPVPLFCSQLPHPSVTDQSLGVLVPETQGQGLQAGEQSHGSDLLEQRIGLMTFL